MKYLTFGKKGSLEVYRLVVREGKGNPSALTRETETVRALSPDLSLVETIPSDCVRFLNRNFEGKTGFRLTGMNFNFCSLVRSITPG